MIKLAKLRRDQNGNGILLCIFVLFFMLGVGGLVVDASILYKEKGEMRKAANAAVLSGAQVIFENDESIKNVVSEILTVNNEPYEKNNLQINRTESKLTYTLPKTVPLYFMKIFGVPSFDLVVTSSAKLGPLSVGAGPVPIGLPDNITFTEGENYPLDLEPGEGISGNYNYLDFSDIKTAEGVPVINPGSIKNHGANALEDYMQYGYNGNICIGYQIETKTGENGTNGYGKVSDAITYRLNSANPNDRILLVILFDNTKQEPGKSPRYVTGFAYFQLEGLVNINNGKNDKGNGNSGKQQIIGKFIKKVATGSTSDGATDYKSAYAIKLVE